MTTTQPPYQIVKNPKETVVTQPVDTELPVAQAACGVQILTGNIEVGDGKVKRCGAYLFKGLLIEGKLKPLNL